MTPILPPGDAATPPHAPPDSPPGDAPPPGTPDSPRAGEGSVLEVLRTFLLLGLTSFGGPVAHLSYFQTDLVERRRWLDGRTYADLVALCQLLPGPASSQVGMAIGIHRAGLLGGLAAWAGFTLPSAVALAIFAAGVGRIESAGTRAALHGLEVVVVPVVGIAVWTMWRNLCPDSLCKAIAILAAVVALVWHEPLNQVILITCGALLGAFALQHAIDEPSAPSGAAPPRGRGFFAGALFLTLLAGLPWLASRTGSGGIEIAARFFRTGALVFGGGHVVLPLLEREVVDPGWISHEQFIAGYGAAQAVPGPLFSFAAYLGYMLKVTPNGAAGSALALLSIYAPAFLLLVATLPFWERLRASPACRAGLAGASAAVVGLLLAAFCDPVCRVAIEGPSDIGLAALALAGLTLTKMPPWLVVGLTAATSGWILN